MYNMDKSATSFTVWSKFNMIDVKYEYIYMQYTFHVVILRDRMVDVVVIFYRSHYNQCYILVIYQHENSPHGMIT